SIEYALVELWRSWGVTPNVVIGHSVGEYAAACVAGVLSLEDALRLIAARGRLMQSLPPGGAMAAIFAPEARVADALAQQRSMVSVAAINGPEQTVISGASEQVAAICGEFAARGVRCQQLVVSHAFHSPLVDPILDAFEKEAASVHFSPPRVRLVSNVSGRAAQPEEITHAGYWRRHMREAVRFGDGLAEIAGLRPDACIEIGPHPTLLSFARDNFGYDQTLLLPSLRVGRGDQEQMLEALASLYLGGAQPDWRGLDMGSGRRITDLPTYPFQRERHWFRARPRTFTGTPRGRSTGHPLLGTKLRGATTETVYESSVSADSPAFVRQHRVQGHVIMPATAYLDTLMAAARDLLGSGRASVEDVTVREAMLLDDGDAARIVQVVCSPVRDDRSTATLTSVDADAGADEAWTAHVSANLRGGATAPTTGPSLEQARAQCTQARMPAELYDGFGRCGLDFGPGFRSVRRLWSGESQALGEVELSADLARDAA